MLAPKPYLFFVNKDKELLFTIKTRAVYIYRSTKYSQETQSRSRQLAAKAWGPDIRVHELRKFSEVITGLRTPVSI